MPDRPNARRERRGVRRERNKPWLASIWSASRPRFGRLRPKKQTSATGVSQLWGGNSLAGNHCQRWLEMFTVFGRDVV